MLAAAALAVCSQTIPAPSPAVVDVPVMAAVSARPYTDAADVAASHDPAPAASRGAERTPVPAPPPAAPVAAPAAPPAVPAAATAVASWYDLSPGEGACGRPCAQWGRYTFAHLRMAFGTAVRFCVNGRCIVAHATDRGPYVAGRTFDLSRTTFAALAPLGAGTVTVSWSLA